MQIFDSYIEAGQQLPEQDKQRFYTALIEYLAYDVEPDLGGAAAAVFIAIKPSLDISKARSKAGSKGGSKRVSKTEANGQGNSNSNSNSNSKSSNKETPSKEGAKKETRPRFTPPTEEQVQAYCKQGGYIVNPQKFINHYQSNGWMVGKNKMKDWKAAVRNWHYRDNPMPPVIEVEDEFSKYA